MRVWKDDGVGVGQPGVGVGVVKKMQYKNPSLRTVERNLSDKSA